MLADIIPKLAAMEQDPDGPYNPRPSLASPATLDDPGRCVRALTYAKLGEPPAPWPGRFLLLLDDSSWHEELTLDWLQKSAFRIHSRQFPIEYPLPRSIGTGGFCKRCKRPISNKVLHGHIDALLTDLLNVDRLLEHKSTNHFSFLEMLEGTPSLDHLTQGCLYLAGLQQLDPAMREAILLIKNRNTSAYCEFRFTYDTQADRCHVFHLVASEGIDRPLDLTFTGLVGNALAKFEAVEHYAAEHVLPTRPYRSDHYRCGYCRFSKTCWSGYPDEVAHREADAQLPTDLVPLLKEYADAAEAKRHGEATTKRLRPRILNALETLNVKSGTGNGYRATVSTQERTTIDPLLLPEEAKKVAETTKTVEILHVSYSSNNKSATPAAEGDAR